MKSQSTIDPPIIVVQELGPREPTPWYAGMVNVTYYDGTMTVTVASLVHLALWCNAIYEARRNESGKGAYKALLDKLEAAILERLNGGSVRKTNA